MGDIKEGHIQFVQNCLPPLDCGEYRITVQEEIALNEASSLPATVNYLAVRGKRFSLDGNDVNGVFPIENQSGEFSNCLPHITLSKKTLPWERTIEGIPQVRTTSNGTPVDAVPWLALLTVYEDDSIKLINATLKDVLEPPAGILPPSISLDAIAGESESDECIAIDIQKDLFEKIIPVKEELSFLAHGRYVNMDNKEVSENLDGGFSTVVSCRLPKSSEEGIKNTMHLVSLEGFSGCFDENGVTVPANYNAVRMISLYRWSFTSSKEEYNFKAIVQKLSLGNLNLSIDTSGGTEGEKNVEKAFQLGYIGVNHTTRAGEKTVSWYRGPLIPMKREASEEAKVYPCANALLRYDPDTGLFDTSYGAAWQLGKLLALQDKSFAVSLYNFRRKNLQQRKVESAKAAIYKNFNKKIEMKKPEEIEKKDSPEYMVLDQCIHRAILPALQKIVAVKGKKRISLNNETFPEDISNWLSRLALLYGVPFNYLLPSEKSMPIESLRFFYLDPHWIDSMVDGACSVGRNSTAVTAQDKVLFKMLPSHIRREVQKIRTKLQGKKNWVEKVSDGDPVSIRSGFLLRSITVSHWNGIEIKGYADEDGQMPLKILRMDKICSDVLMCIFEGELQRVEIAEPVENLHFAVEENEAGNYVKSLRSLGANGHPIGEIIENVTPLEVPIEEDQVVKIKDFVANINTELKSIGENSLYFTAAEFSLQMIGSAERGIFLNKREEKTI